MISPLAFLPLGTLRRQAVLLSTDFRFSPHFQSSSVLLPTLFLSVFPLLIAVAALIQEHRRHHNS